MGENLTRLKLEKSVCKLARAKFPVQHCPVDAGKKKTICSEKMQQEQRAQAQREKINHQIKRWSYEIAQENRWFREQEKQEIARLMKEEDKE